MSISSNTPRGRLLEAKLHIPQAPRDGVLRPRLMARLEQSVTDGGKITLVSAPAGYGKSILLADWSRYGGRSCAWVSLDERDNHLPILVRYLVAAVRKVFSGACAGMDDLLESSELPAPEAVAERTCSIRATRSCWSSTRRSTPNLLHFGACGLGGNVVS